MAFARDTIPQLEAAIGLAQRPGNEVLIQQHYVGDAAIKGLLIRWLIKHGIPASGASVANVSSVAKAYCNPSYLRGWRNRVNPNFALLGGEDDDAAEAEAQSAADAAHAANAAQGANSEASASLPVAEPAPAVDHKASEAWLAALFAQVDRSVAKLVDQRLANATMTMAEGAKAQVRQMVVELAETIAKKTVEQLMPPREFKIIRQDANSGSVSAEVIGLQHDRFPTLLRAAQARDHRGFRLNIWLTGPTGSGKTTAAENVARALALPFGSDGSLDADYKVLGFRDANGHVISTQFLDIYEKGGIYVADEIDNWLPSALLSLNAALANGWVSSPRGMIQRHPDACVIACANTWGLGATSDYVGRTKLDAASLDRFQPKIDWPIDETLELALARRQANAIGSAWHQVIRTARQSAKGQGLKIIISPRATFNGLALLAQGFTPDEVVAMTFAAGLSEDQKRNLNVRSALGHLTEALAQNERQTAERQASNSEPAADALAALDEQAA